MAFEEARPFLEQHHWGVVTTFQPDGAAHSLGRGAVCWAWQ